MGLKECIMPNHEYAVIRTWARWFFGVMILPLGLIGGCEGSGPSDTDPDIIPSNTSIQSFVYQLQNVDLDALGKTRFDLVVMDYSRDGSDAEQFTAAEISALQNSSGGAKKVLAYMSIGEAETYRWYWNPAWDVNEDGQPDSGAPAWLGPSNPDWPGNYKVRYWDSQWQTIVFGSATSYLDRIIDAGFDGVYLDIIDAFEYWGPDGSSGLNRASAPQEMVDLVKAIAQYARVTRGRPDFMVFPQNGEALAAYPDYVQTVTGVGKEDTWYLDNDLQSASETAEVLENLDIFRDAGKTILVIDYVTQAALIDAFYTKAADRGYIPYATGRNLDALTINPGHEP